MTREELRNVAWDLYSGDWRAEDRTQLKAEYDFSDEEVEAVCEALREIADHEGEPSEHEARVEAFAEVGVALAKVLSGTVDQAT